MARGWESKAVEDQMEEALRSQAEKPFHVQSPAMIERERKIESLRLQRSRLAEQLSRARSAAHRQMIEQSLRAIEQEIESLSEI